MTNHMSHRQSLPLALLLTLCATVSGLPQASTAQGLQDQIVELQTGNWAHQQEIHMAGKKIPQGSLSGEECLPEAQSKLPVSHYV